MTDTRRRVKVYTLNEDRQWDDRGTGHVSSGYVERLKGMSLLVRAESDGSLLLESKINPNTAYQKQQVNFNYFTFSFFLKGDCCFFNINECSMSLLPFITSNATCYCN
uniref:PP4R3 EVH1-like domain-containing protein n=1 Tax=Chelonoidis abingdonii TaxID=106734 RepID=A0A8C0G6Q5_CHEAB